MYRITPEFADILDEATAIAAIEDLGVPLDFETAKAKVKESYRIYRDGGEIFVKEYGIDPRDIFLAYHKRKPVEPIVPYDNLLEKLEALPCEQYIFSTSTREICEKILKHIGLYDFSKAVFIRLKILIPIKRTKAPKFTNSFAGVSRLTRKTAFLLTTAIQTLNFPKKSV